MIYFKVILNTFNIFFAKFKNYYQKLISFLNPLRFYEIKTIDFTVKP